MFGTMRSKQLALAILVAMSLGSAARASNPPFFLEEWSWDGTGRDSTLSINGRYRLTAQWQPGLSLYFDNRKTQIYSYCGNYSPERGSFNLCLQSSYVDPMMRTSASGYEVWDIFASVGRSDLGVPYTSGYSFYDFYPAIVRTSPEWYSADPRPHVAFKLELMYAVVPEPAAWLLLISGFGFVGVAFRQRRSGASASGATAVR